MIYLQYLFALVGFAHIVRVVGRKFKQKINGVKNGRN